MDNFTGLEHADFFFFFVLHTHVLLEASIFLVIVQHTIQFETKSRQEENRMNIHLPAVCLCIFLCQGMVLSTFLIIENFCVAFCFVNIMARFNIQQSKHHFNIRTPDISGTAPSVLEDDKTGTGISQHQAPKLLRRINLLLMVVVGKHQFCFSQQYYRECKKTSHLTQEIKKHASDSAELELYCSHLTFFKSPISLPWNKCNSRLRLSNYSLHNTFLRPSWKVIFISSYVSKFSHILL